MKRKLGDLAIIVKSKDSVEKIDRNKYVTTENMISNRGGVSFPSSTVPKQKKLDTFGKDDVLVSNIRPYFKKIWKASFSGYKSGDVLAFRTKDRDILSQEYLYILLESDRFFEYMTTTAKGTKMPRADKKAIAEFPFDLPSIDIQKKRSHQIEVIEQKIHLNQQINANLVYFLDAEFQNRFINRNYPTGEVQNYVNIKRGASPRPIKDYLVQKGRPWIKISDVTSLDNPFLYQTKQYIKKQGINKSRTVVQGTLIISNSATPGIPIISQILASVHDGWLIVSDYKLMNRNWFYLFFKQMRKSLVARANGSVFNNLKTDIVKHFPVPIISHNELDNFDKNTKPIFQKLNQLHLENIELNEVKQTLLNKLF